MPLKLFSDITSPFRVTNGIYFHLNFYLKLVSNLCKNFLCTLRSLLNKLACLRIVTILNRASSFNRDLRVLPKTRNQQWFCHFKTILTLFHWKAVGTDRGKSKYFKYYIGTSNIIMHDPTNRSFKYILKVHFYRLMIQGRWKVWKSGCASSN